MRYMTLCVILLNLYQLIGAVGIYGPLPLPTFRQVLISHGVSGACHGSLRFTCSQAPREKQRPPRRG